MKFVPTRQRGFSLIELLIVVAIIAVLAAIAIPSYQRYMYRARRVEGQQLLMSVANAEERYYATHNQYGSLSDIGVATTSQNNFYTASPASSSTSTQAYSFEADPNTTQSKDACGSLTINNLGVKGPTDTAHTTNGPCW
jgi:type IV pilus assembly protein PilE